MADSGAKQLKNLYKRPEGKQVIELLALHKSISTIETYDDFKGKFNTIKTEADNIERDINNYTKGSQEDVRGEDYLKQCDILLKIIALYKQTAASKAGQIRKKNANNIDRMNALLEEMESLTSTITTSKGKLLKKEITQWNLRGKLRDTLSSEIKTEVDTLLTLPPITDTQKQEAETEKTEDARKAVEYSAATVARQDAEIAKMDKETANIRQALNIKYSPNTDALKQTYTDIKNINQNTDVIIFLSILQTTYLFIDKRIEELLTSTEFMDYSIGNIKTNKKYSATETIKQFIIVLKIFEEYKKKAATYAEQIKANKTIYTRVDENLEKIKKYTSNIESYIPDYLKKIISKGNLLGTKKAALRITIENEVNKLLGIVSVNNVAKAYLQPGIDKQAREEAEAKAEEAEGETQEVEAKAEEAEAEAQEEAEAEAQEEVTKPLPRETIEGIKHLDTNATLLNIAGEIINLEGRANNSGRLNAEQFGKMYTTSPEERDLMRKVFGIPTLRHTPKILTKTGCSLTEDEAKIIEKILTARMNSLKRGTEFTSQLTLDSTNQKILNIKILLARISDMKNNNNTVECIPVTAPVPSAPPTTEHHDPNAEKLLILTLTLVIGIASEKIRAKNIKQRLSTVTISDIIQKISNKTTTTKNAENFLHKMTGIPQDITENIADSEIKEIYTKLTNEIDTFQTYYNDLLQAKATAEGALKGNEEAIEELRKTLEACKAKAGQATETVINSATNNPEATSTLETAKSEGSILEGSVASLETARVQENEKLEDIREKLATADEDKEVLKKRFEELKTQIISLHKTQIDDLKQSIRTKEEYITKKKELVQTLRDSGKSQVIAKEDLALYEKELATLQAKLKKEEAKMELARQQKVEFNVNESNVAEITINSALRTRILGITEALEKIIKKTGNADAKAKVQQLTDALESAPVPDNNPTAIDEFKGSLKNLLLQHALLDKDPENLNALDPEQIIEPMEEKLCILYFFITTFWKQLNVGGTTEESEIGLFIKKMDKTFLPDTKDEELWATITQLGKVIHFLSKGKVGNVLPENKIITQLNIADTSQKSANATKYKQTLTQIITSNKYKIIPKSDKFIETNGENGWIIKENPVEHSVLELPYLFLLEMKLLSRYIDYIIKNAPQQLECRGLGLPIELY